MVQSSGIKHLRAHGAFLYKRNTTQHLTLVSAKKDVEEVPYDRVTEAFGTENYPHLVHMLAEGDDVLKKRVLMALSSVFKLPQNLVMCLKFGVLELIENGIVEGDNEIRELSALVLSVMAESPCGQSEIINGETLARLKDVFAGVDKGKACASLYDAFVRISRSFIGGERLSKNGYLDIVLDHLKQKLSRNLCLRVLQLLKNILNDGQESTVYRAIELESMDLCMKHLFNDQYEIRVAACDAIAALACVEKGKRAAVEKGVVPTLCHLLTDANWQVTAASAGALMRIAINDDAKRAIVAADGLVPINQLLQSSKLLVQLNTVKFVAVIAAFPPARQLLDVSSTEYHLRTLMSDPDQLLARSAKIALQTVQWKA